MTNRTPNGETTAGTRKINLYSCAPDNRRLVLWQYAATVAPISAFERAGCWIQSGHYVIYYNENPIVVHCGNLSDNRVSVQFMVGERTVCPFARSTIESMLLAKVVVSKEQQAAVFERKRLSDFFKE